MEILSFVLICANTIAVIAVIYIQKTQINRMQTITDMMTKYMTIFKVDDVKKYVELKDELSHLEAQKFVKEYIKDSEHIKELITEVISSEGKQPINDELDKYMNEILSFVVLFLKSLPEDKRHIMTSQYLKISGPELLKIIES